jgi:hypothetical protein
MTTRRQARRLQQGGLTVRRERAPPAGDYFDMEHPVEARIHAHPKSVLPALPALVILNVFGHTTLVALAAGLVASLLLGVLALERSEFGVVLLSVLLKVCDIVVGRL